MKKIDQARDVLRQLGISEAQQSDICCYALLALAGLGAGNGWVRAGNEWVRIHDIIGFCKN